MKYIRTYYPHKKRDNWRVALALIVFLMGMAVVGISGF